MGSISTTVRGDWPGERNTSARLELYEWRRSSANAVISEILGFDIRVVVSPGIARRWGALRRKHYLLRPDVPWVASADSAVFSSIFDFGNTLNGADEALTRLIPENVHQQALGLWCDLDAMQQTASRLSLPEGAVFMAIAITALEEFPRAEGPWDDLLEERTNPETVNQRWRLLGYDVADRFLLSGLSNCGYDGDEKATFTIAWSGKLNEVGLLSDLNDAAEFKNATNRRVPEHAPFSVFGLIRR